MRDRLVRLSARHGGQPASNGNDTLVLMPPKGGGETVMIERFDDGTGRVTVGHVVKALATYGPEDDPVVTHLEQVVEGILTGGCVEYAVIVDDRVWVGVEWSIGYRRGQLKSAWLRKGCAGSPRGHRALPGAAVEVVEDAVAAEASDAPVWVRHGERQAAEDELVSGAASGRPEIKFLTDQQLGGHADRARATNARPQRTGRALPAGRPRRQGLLW